jgi:integral membrane protein
VQSSQQLVFAIVTICATLLFYRHEKDLGMNIKTLRWVGFLEGISFLLLLFIAMPMKYMFDNPILVKYVGMGHGVLFIAFLVVLFVVCEKQKWSLKMFILGLIASILPFGPFVFDAKLKKMEQPVQA